MPLLQTRGSASVKGFGTYNQAATPVFVEDVFSTWLYTGNNGAQNINNGIPLASTAEFWGVKFRESSSSVGYGISTDSSGNVYVTGYANDGNLYAFIAKYNTSGTLQWQRKFRESSSQGYGISTDSSGNVYVTGQAYDGSNYAFIAKYNTSGTLQWQRKFRQSDSYGNGISTDSSGNVYVIGSANDGSSYAFIAKYNTSGTLQWQRKFRESSNSVGYGISTDSSGNVYVIGNAQDGSSYAFIAKYNTSGTLQWQRKFRESSSFGYGISTDSSGNVYVTGYAIDGDIYAFIAKYNTSGTLQWQRKFREVSSSAGSGISTDSSGNVYVTGNANDGNIYAFIAKYNTSGTLQWQRKFRESASVGQGISTDSSGNVYVTGRANDGSNYAFTLKLAQDGSTTSGTVNNGTLTNGTATDSAGTATDSSGTATDSAGTATDSAGTATDSAGTATSTTQTQVAVEGKGGLTIFKGRSGATDWAVYDTTRGATFDLATNTTAAQTTQSAGLTAFNTDGFSIGALANINTSGATYASWTFAEQAKFFDVVPYTGNGVGGRNISHNLGSAPGCIIIKCTSTTSNWMVWHRSISGQNNLYLNTTDGTSTVAADPISVPGFPSSLSTTVFTVDVGTDSCNTNGATYVALVFAHNAGGFGLSGTENVISCGSYAGSASAVDVNLGYEAQFVMVKNITTGSTNWELLDTMRGMPLSGYARTLNPNLSDAEGGLSAPQIVPTATGFTVASGLGTTINTSGNTYIYIAIRRGPMQVPTSGASVFGISARSGTGANATVTGGTRSDDLVVIKNRGSAQLPLFASRLTETGYLDSSSTAAEVAAGTTILQANPWDVMDGIKVGSTSAITNASSNTFVNYLLSRAPGFHDQICYSGTGSNKTETHNLTVQPELWLAKRIDSTGSWVFGSTLLNANEKVVMPSPNGRVTDTTVWNNTYPTSSVISLGTSTDVNASGGTYSLWMWASAPGVSKVFSYTGNGSSQTINCGFAGGARFVMIIRATASTSQDVYIWDSARGIVAGNDPRLSLNTTAAEVTTLDSVDADSTGFVVNQDASNVNVNGAVYFGIAIA